MLTLEPKAWYSWDFRVLDGDRELALLDRRVFREDASFDLDGATYAIRRTSLVRGTFVLEGETGMLAEARKTSVFRRAFEIRAGPETWHLEAARPLFREFRLRRDRLPLGSIRPAAPLFRRATVELDDRVPLPLQIFVSFLVLVLWKRAADAASGS